MSDDVVNNDRAFQTAWIVYINGIEVPVVSARVSYGVWKIPECEIVVIPDSNMHRFGAEDRVTVQVFYCDYWIAPDRPEFRLMFDGEIVSWGYVNVKQGRALSFQCVDYIQIFTQLFFFFMSSIDTLAIGASQQSIGVSANVIQTAGYGAIYPYSLFSQGLVDPGGSPEGEQTVITKPIDFVYNVVRALIKKQLPDRGAPASNFFAPWVKRTKFHKRFLSLPLLEEPTQAGGEPAGGVFPILRAVNATYAVDAVARMVQQEPGNAGSIWMMLQNILQLMMMEVNMLPTPPVVSSNYVTLEAGGPPTPANQDPTKPIMLGNYFVKPQFIFGIPPVFNVFFPSQINQYSYDENFITQPTRMYFSEEALMGYLQVDNNTTPGGATIMRDAMSVGYPPEVDQRIQHALMQPGENGKNLLVYPEEFFKGPVIDRREMPRWMFFLKNAQQQVPESSESAESSEAVPGSDDPTRDIFRLYAAYEYFKERYSRRIGGLQLAFNPYPVPGFPCAVFDRRSEPLDTMGYVTNVVQTLTSRGQSTQVSFTFGRTLQEVFKLLEQQFATENLGVDAVAGSIATGSGAAEVQPIGTIAVAPPEPLPEIRDVIQNFDRASAFYKSLFFRGGPITASQVSQLEISAQSHHGEVSESETLESLPEEVQGSISSAASEKRTIFYYPDLVQLSVNGGRPQDIVIDGADSLAKREALRVISAMQSGTATDAEVAYIREATGISDLQPAPRVEGAASTDAGLLLTNAEQAVRTWSTTSNITGSADIVVKPEATPMFESYEVAMQYCSRPICTLDEYIDFLGDAGVKDFRIDPRETLAQGDPRTFAAHYYTRIRNYTTAPLPILPETDITGTEVVEGSSTVTLVGLPPEFPDTRADWTAALLAYRANALSKLPPRT